MWKKWGKREENFYKNQPPAGPIYLSHNRPRHYKHISPACPFFVPQVLPS